MGRWHRLPMNKNTNNKQKKGKAGIPRSKPKQRNVPKSAGPQSGDRHIREIVKQELNKEVDPDELKCIQEYALARADPFAVRGLPCGPTSDPGRSVRFRTASRGQFNVGTNNGFIVFNPYYGFGGVSGFHSESTYVSDGINCNAGVGITPISPYSPYNASDFTKIKVVGWGLKVWYIGKAQDAAGMIYRLRNPNNQKQNVAVTSGNLSASPNNTWEAVRPGKVYSTCFVPQNDEDDEFEAQTAPTTAAPAWTAGFYIANATAGSTFAFEQVAYYEAVPSPDSPFNIYSTYSPEYKVGGTKVNQASVEADSRSNAKNDTSPGFWKEMVAQGVRAAFSSYLGPEATETVARFVEMSGYNMPSGATPGARRLLM